MRKGAFKAVSWPEKFIRGAREGELLLAPPNLRNCHGIILAFSWRNGQAKFDS
jgi:hypothetical protein